MSSTPQFNVAQLAAARSEHWHQSGEALLTIEAAREWVNESGLVLFAPRGHQLPMPAPTLVEATLGRTVPAPTAAESETARGLVARMVADGSVLPLNLLGGAGDVPDFVVSAQMFSYVFTLRGDKNWKQPPSTSGPVKVSPLSLKVYEVLEKGSALTAGELVGELGREVTENAISRALTELWAQMRVIPLLQQDGSATMWELTSRRFTKQLKAGANAGQPTALSALVSVYMAQVFAALEDEVETFLSPLAARSRVRDVLHGLTAGRQLEPVVLEGKTLLYIPGALPEFPEIAAEEVAVEGEEGTATLAVSAEAPERIRRFDRPRGPREQRGERPARREGEGRAERSFRREGASGKSFGDRERRPFQRDRAERSGAEGERKSFARPWDEERKPRPRGEHGKRREGARPFRKEGERAGGEFRKGPKREFGARPRRDDAERGERTFRPRREGEGGERPVRPRREGAGGERPFRPRRDGAGGERPVRPRREGAGGERPFRPRREAEGGERPFRPRREGAAGERPSRPRGEGAAGERPFRPRRAEGERSERGERPFRPRREGEGARGEGRAERPFRRREEGSGEGRPPKRPFRSAEGGERPRPSGERRTGGRPGGKPGFGGKPAFGGKGKFGAKRAAGGPGGGRPKFGGKPGGKPGSAPRDRNVRAKDMRAKGKGERPRGPRPEVEE